MFLPCCGGGGGGGGGGSGDIRLPPILSDPWCPTTTDKASFQLSL